MTADSWPKAGTYSVAARDVRAFFVDDRLKDSAFRTSPLGVPLGATGRNAVVFRITSSDGVHAVRFFTTAPSEGRLRYGRLADHLVAYPTPAVAAAEWVDEAVDVLGVRLPMVRMEWVEGRNLDAYIRDNVDDGERMQTLARGWRDLLVEMESAQLGHGDLQHGNVLVEDDGALRLVDLDAVWTPTTSDLHPPDVGHVNYQHPQRISEGYWSASVDAFSALVIAVSLEALAQAPGLWGEYHDGANNLLLTERDFRSPGMTPLWSDLAALDDPVPEMLGRLGRACGDDVADLPMPVALVTPGGDWWEAFHAPIPTTPPGRPATADDDPDGTALAKRFRDLRLSGLTFVLLATAVALVALVGGIVLLGAVILP